jgi:hypothetical protein
MNEPAEIDLKLPIRGSLGQRRNLDLANLCGPAAPPGPSRQLQLHHYRLEVQTQTKPAGTCLIQLRW